MSLVTTIEQVRAVIGSAIRKENTFEILHPYVEKAEEELIKDLIGQAQLTALYGTLTGSAQKLQTLVRSAIVWNGYLDAWYQGFYQFTGSGVNKQTVKDTDSLFRYQEDNIQKDIVRKADEATERLMLFLEANSSSFPLYKDSDQFAENFAYLISTPTVLQRALPEVSKSYRMYQVLRRYMDRVENVTVRSVAGDDLYEDIKQKVASGSTLDTNYKKLLTLSQDYAAPATLLDAMPWISVQFSPSGIRILKVFNNLQDENPLNDIQTAGLMGLLKTRIDEAKTSLRVFLNSVASESLFPDYFNSELYRAPGSKIWTTPDNENKKHFRL
jgi:hypothetical protein